MRKERSPGPFESEATALVKQLWETCGEGPKPVLNGNGNPFIAARKIAEKFLEAGYEADRVGAAMWKCHNESVITTAAVAFALTAEKRRTGTFDTPPPLEYPPVKELYPGAHLMAKVPVPPKTPEDIERGQAAIREMQERFRGRRG